MAAAGNYPQKLPQRGCGTAKKRGTGLPVPHNEERYLRLLKDILAHSTDGANPAVGDLVPGGAGGDAVVGVACGGVVLIAAGANVLIHIVLTIFVSFAFAQAQRLIHFDVRPLPNANASLVCIWVPAG